MVTGTNDGVEMWFRVLFEDGQENTVAVMMMWWAVVWKSGSGCCLDKTLWL